VPESDIIKLFNLFNYLVGAGEQSRRHGEPEHNRFESSGRPAVPAKMVTLAQPNRWATIFPMIRFHPLTLPKRKDHKRDNQCSGHNPNQVMQSHTWLSV
jgi:hypothetical protein